MNIANYFHDMKFIQYSLGMLILLTFLVISALLIGLVFRQKKLLFYYDQENKPLVVFFKQSVFFSLTVIIFTVGTNDFIYQRNGNSEFRSIRSFINPRFETDQPVSIDEVDETIKEVKYYIILDKTLINSVFELDSIQIVRIKEEICENLTTNCTNLLNSINQKDLFVYYILRRIADFTKIEKKDISIYTYGGTKIGNQKPLQKQSEFIIDGSTLTNKRPVELGLTTEFELVNERLSEADSIISPNIHYTRSYFEETINLLISDANIEKTHGYPVNIIFLSDFVQEIKISAEESKNELRSSLNELNQYFDLDRANFSLIVLPGNPKQISPKYIASLNVQNIIESSLTNFGCYKLEPYKLLRESPDNFKNYLSHALSIKIKTSDVNYDPSGFKIKSLKRSGRDVSISNSNDFSLLNNYQNISLSSFTGLSQEQSSNGFQCHIFDEKNAGMSPYDTGVISVSRFVPTNFISSFYLFLMSICISIIGIITILFGITYFRAYLKLVNNGSSSINRSSQKIITIIHILSLVFGSTLVIFNTINYSSFYYYNFDLFLLFIVFQVVGVGIPYKYYKGKEEWLQSASKNLNQLNENQ